MRNFMLLSLILGMFPRFFMSFGDDDGSYGAGGADGSGSGADGGTPGVAAGGGEGDAAGGALDPKDWRSMIDNNVKIKHDDKEISLREHPSVSKFKNPSDLAKSYVELENYRGKSVVIPGENATPAEKDAFANRIGRPEKADGYKLSPVQNLHESVKPTEAGAEGYKQAAHEMRLTQEQTDKMYSWFMGIISKGAAMDEAARKETIEKNLNSLKSEWQDKFDSNVALATAHVKKIGGDDALDAFGDLKANPLVLKTLVESAKMVSEDGPGNEGNQNNMTSDQSSALQQINAIKNDLTHAYHNEKDPKHAEAVKELTALYNKAYPERK